MKNWGTNRKQFVLERATFSACIVPALVIALAPVVSLSKWYGYVAAIAIVVLVLAYFYMAVYRAYIKKDWYKCKMIFPGYLALFGVLFWVMLPFPPDPHTKSSWVPFLLIQYFILAAVVDYRVYFGLLKEDNPETE